MSRDLEPTYRYLGNEHFVDLIRTAFGVALERHDYHLEVGLAGPVTPNVYEYRKEGSVYSVSVDERAGEKWEAQLEIETNSPQEELESVVQGAMVRSLADLSTRLIESVVDERCRSHVAGELNKVIAALE